MGLNKNIFYATNPARMLDALGRVIDDANVALADMLIFLPSRRAVRTVEKYLVARAGHGIILPRLVALGEGDDEDRRSQECHRRTPKQDVQGNHANHGEQRDGEMPLKQEGVQDHDVQEQ